MSVYRGRVLYDLYDLSNEDISYVNRDTTGRECIFHFKSF